MKKAAVSATNSEERFFSIQQIEIAISVNEDIREWANELFTRIGFNEIRFEEGLIRCTEKRLFTDNLLLAEMKGGSVGTFRILHSAGSRTDVIDSGNSIFEASPIGKGRFSFSGKGSEVSG